MVDRAGLCLGVAWSGAGGRGRVRLVPDRPGPSAAGGCGAVGRRWRQPAARSRLPPGAALEDLLAVAGRCRLSAAPGLGGVEQFRRRDDGVAGAAALLGAGPRHHRLHRCGGVSPHRSARAGETGYAALIARYAARVPRDGGAGLALAAATVIPSKQPVLELRVKAEQLLHAPDAFIEGPEGVTFGAPRLVHGEAPGEALLRLPVFGERPAIERMVGHPVTVTLVDGERSLEAAIAPAAGPPAADFRLLLGVLPLALLGGLILNFMPCVLPVLSIKILGMVEQGGRSRRAVRLGFLATAAGVIVSFLALAAAMVALLAAGVAVGWGVQFQQPLFLVGMVALLTLFACNLWGFFEVPLPSALAALGSAGEGRLLLGNFAAGAFATLLATPCSAPFLGTAIGFALAAGPFEIFAIFLALGLGLAAPYLLVALLPRLALWLPRPGHWMLTLRRVLGLALAATALWLVSVLVAQTGAPAAPAAGALIAGAAGG